MPVDSMTLQSAHRACVPVRLCQRSDTSVSAATHARASACPPPARPPSAFLRVYVLLVQEPDYPSGLSYDAVSFMMQALEKQPQKRPTVKQLLAHPWFDRLPRHKQQQQQLASA